MARLLDLAYEQLQLPILLLPHVSTFGAQDGDQECHAAIARLSKAPNIRVLDQRRAGETAALTANAELIISSRYHPVIFGLSAGVPVLPVATDYYGEVRIGGALENWGLRPLLRSLRHLADEGDTKWVNSVIGQRAEIRNHLQQQGQRLEAFHASWWDSLAAVLDGASVPGTPTPLPVVNSSFSLILEQAESQEAARLNASNEIAIGNLAQHRDWLEGELSQRAERPDPLSQGLAVLSQAGQKLLTRKPSLAAAKRLASRLAP
jgi:hypothetical protein